MGFFVPTLPACAMLCGVEYTSLSTEEHVTGQGEERERSNALIFSPLRFTECAHR